METISGIVNDVTCPGVLINLIITVVVLLVGTIFGVTAIKKSEDGGMKIKIIVVMTGLYLFWLLWGTFWHRLSSRLCENSLYSDSAFISLSPLIFIVVISFTVLFVLGMLELIKLLVGKKWEEIVLLTEFKDKVDGTKIILKDSTIGEEIIEKGRKLEKQADNLKFTISDTLKMYRETKDPGTKKLLDDYIKKEKKLRAESKKELNRGRVYSDKYFGRNFMIENVNNNPYGLILRGIDNNSHKKCEVIIEHRLKNGWSGIVKILELDKNRPDIKYLDKGRYDSLFNKEYNIKKESYAKIKLVTLHYENVVIIEDKKETRKYNVEGKGVGQKLLHGTIILLVFLLAFGIGFGLLSGETFNLSNILDKIEEGVKSNFEEE